MTLGYHTGTVVCLVPDTCLKNNNKNLNYSNSASFNLKNNYFLSFWFILECHLVLNKHL